MSSADRYREEVTRLRLLGKEWNLTDPEIERIIDESFEFLEQEEAVEGRGPSAVAPSRSLLRSRTLSRILWASLLLLFLFVYLPQFDRRAAHAYVERSVQEVIYPGMKLVRKLMLPLIRTFPSLTEWYDEACLVGNPYFQVSDIDCWPCQGVRSILNLTSSNLTSDQYHSGLPFILKDDKLNGVSVEDIAALYSKKKTMFNKDAARVYTSDRGWVSSQQLFLDRPLHLNPSSHRSLHITWKLNRLEPTRAFRNLFGMPSQLPSYVAGATTEKYILLDENESPPYSLPDTEGSNVFIIQGSGHRLLLLKPSPECTSSCPTSVSILLQPNHILWFNWWYWRAVSIPAVSQRRTEIKKEDDYHQLISVTYVGSYY